MFAQTQASCLEDSAKSTIRPNAADSRSLAPRRILGGSGGSGRGRGSLRLAHTVPRKQTSRGTLRPVQRRGKLGNCQEPMDYIAGNRHSNRSALSEMQRGGSSTPATAPQAPAPPVFAGVSFEAFAHHNRAAQPPCCAVELTESGGGVRSTVKPRRISGRGGGLDKYKT